MSITLNKEIRDDQGTLQKVVIGSVTGADLQSVLDTGGEPVEFGDQWYKEDVEKDIAEAGKWTVKIGDKILGTLGINETEFITGTKQTFSGGVISGDVEDKLEHAKKGEITLLRGRAESNIFNGENTMNTDEIKDFATSTKGMAVIGAGIAGIVLFMR